jgi:hypothetical protein
VAASGTRRAVLVGVLCALLAAPQAASAQKAEEEESSSPFDSGVEVAPGIYLAPVSEVQSGPGGHGPKPAPALRRPQIVGGSPTTIDRWPWQVAILSEGRRCGGTLVAPTIVVSAAHCFWNVPIEAGFNDPSSFLAITGRTRLSSGAGQVHDVVAIHAFIDDLQSPLWDPDTNEWDVVVLLIDPPAPASGRRVSIAGPGE